MRLLTQSKGNDAHPARLQNDQFESWYIKKNYEIIEHVANMAVIYLYLVVSLNPSQSRSPFLSRLSRLYSRMLPLF